MQVTAGGVLAQRLRALRLEQPRLAQSRVAKDNQIGAKAYGTYERGTRTPSAGTVALLAGYFGTSVDYLLGRTDIRMQENARSVLKDTNHQVDKGGVGVGLDQAGLLSQLLESQREIGRLQQRCGDLEEELIRARGQRDEGGGSAG